jgi:hypothetical protein
MPRPTSTRRIDGLSLTLGPIPPTLICGLGARQRAGRQLDCERRRLRKMVALPVGGSAGKPVAAPKSLLGPRASDDQFAPDRPRRHSGACLRARSGSGRGDDQVREAMQSAMAALSCVARQSVPWGDREVRHRARVAGGRRRAGLDRSLGAGAADRHVAGRESSRQTRARRRLHPRQPSAPGSRSSAPWKHARTTADLWLACAVS